MTAEIVPFRIETQSDGELRVSDIELAERLGYTEVRNFRKVIRKNAEDLREFGLLRQIDAKGSGRSERVHWLNRAQAIHAVYRSNTPNAARMAINLTKAFDTLLGNQPVTRDLLRLNILSPEVRVWEKRFEKPFFVNLHRVLGLAKTGRNNHPNCGHFINRYVYDFLFGEIGLEVIREANPKIIRANDNGAAEYQRAFRHHQMLKPEHDKVFNQHIRTLNTLLGIANSIGHFDDIFNATFPKSCTQIGFAFNEQRLGLSAAQGARP